MSTGSDIVNDAMYACGALGASETVSADDAALVLRRLNRMLDSWSTVKELCFETFFDSFPMVAGTQSYSTTLSSAGRPLEVNEMRVTLNNVDYPIEIVGDAEWSRIPYKLVQALPYKCWIDTGFPNTTYNFYPIPEQAYTCYVGQRRPLTNTIALATTLSFPPGYEKALVDSLAVDIAPSFRRPVTPDMQAAAAAAKQVLRTINYTPELMAADFGSSPKYSYADFLRGI